MPEDEESIIGYIKIFLVIFAGVFLACFFIGLLKAREDGKQVLKETYWIEKYVAEHIKIIPNDNKYRLSFKYPENNIKFLFDLSTNTVNELSGFGVSLNDFVGQKVGLFNSQTIEIGAGIITSTILATHKNSIKAIYKKKPKSGIVAVITAIAAAVSGHWIGYKIGMPNLEPDLSTLKNFLRKAENWKQIKRASLHAVILPNYIRLKGSLEALFGKKIEEALFGKKKFGKFDWIKSDIFEKLKKFSIKISRTDYVITNKDFIEAKEIFHSIFELEPKSENKNKFSFARYILQDPFNPELDNIAPKEK